jgi:hypothetical protein
MVPPESFYYMGWRGADEAVSFNSPAHNLKPNGAVNGLDGMAFAKVFSE